MNVVIDCEPHLFDTSPAFADGTPAVADGPAALDEAAADGPAAVDEAAVVSDIAEGVVNSTLAAVSSWQLPLGSFF